WPRETLVSSHFLNLREPPNGRRVSGERGREADAPVRRTRMLGASEPTSPPFGPSTEHSEVHASLVNHGAERPRGRNSPSRARGTEKTAVTPSATCVQTKNHAPVDL